MKTYTESALSDKIKEFLSTFKDANGKFKYVELIDSSISKPSILIHTSDFIQSDKEDSLELYQLLNQDPKEFLKAIKRAVKEIFNEKYQNRKKEFEIYLDDVENKISIIEALGNNYIEKIVMLTGIITSSSTIFNTPKRVFYKCVDNHVTEVIVKDDNSFKAPTKCSNQKCSHRDLEIIIPNDEFMKHRILFLKDDEDFSYQNDEIEVDVTGILTEYATIGDRVQVTGIVEPKFNSKTKTFQNHIKCCYVKKLDDVDLRISKEDEEVFRQYPEEPDFYQRMVHSIAPSILGLEPIRESLLLQRIGSQDIQKRDGTKVRGWMHIGLFGDPSTAKTKLGEWESDNLPRTQFVMSKGATHTGLIMGLEEGSDGRKILRGGALINCRSGGVCVLDEFPRLSSEVIDGLYTTAENGIASIAKTGHQAKIKADASLLVTGNAHNGKWNEALNVQDNLGIDGVFLQRFDFIWVLIDNFNQKQDENLANAILDDIDYLDSVKPFSSTTLSKYIKFVQNFKPETTPEVNEYLKKTWLELRRNEDAKENGISPRHLNTLIRTTLAIARLYQRPYANAEDANKAINLIRQMFKQRNISISEADTYIQRCLNKALEILKDEPYTGIRVDDLFDKVITFGTTEHQDQAKADLGTVRNLSMNKKWREVIEALKRSPLINIVSEKPLMLAYDKTKGDLRSWS